MEFIKNNYKGLLLCLVIAIPSWILGKMFPKGLWDIPIASKK